MASGRGGMGSGGTSADAKLRIGVELDTSQQQFAGFASALSDAVVKTLIEDITKKMPAQLAAAGSSGLSSQRSAPRIFQQVLEEAAMSAGLPGGITVRARVPGSTGASGITFQGTTPYPLDELGYQRHANARARLENEFEREKRRAQRVGVPQNALGTAVADVESSLSAYGTAIDPNTGKLLYARPAEMARLSARESLATLRALNTQYADTNAQQSADADLMSARQQIEAVRMQDIMSQMSAAGLQPSAEMLRYSKPKSRADMRRARFYGSRGAQEARREVSYNNTRRNLETTWDIFSQQVSSSGLSPEAYDAAHTATLEAMLNPDNPEVVNAARNAMRKAKAQFTSDRSAHRGSMRESAGVRRRLQRQLDRYADAFADGDPRGMGLPASRLAAIQGLLGNQSNDPKIKQMQEEAITDLRDAARNVKQSTKQDSTVRALGRYAARGVLGLGTNIGASVFQNGIESVPSGVIAGVGSASGALFSAGLTTMNPIMMALGAVGSLVSSIGGAAYERGSKKRQAGMSAAVSIEQLARPYSTLANTNEYVSPAEEYWSRRSLQAQATGRFNLGGAPVVPSTGFASAGAFAQNTMSSAEVQRRQRAAAKYDTSLDRADLLKSITGQLAQPAFGFTTQQALAFSGGYLGAARFNPFTALRGDALRTDILSGAMSGLDPELVAQGRYLSMRGVVGAPGTRTSRRGFSGTIDQMFERAGLPSGMGFNLTGGAYGALGVAQSFGRYGAEANKFVNFALGLGEQSLARMGNSANLNALLGTATSLGKSGQSLESVQNYMQQSMSNAERSRDFFLSPFKDLGYMVRIAHGARGGGSITDMARRSAGMTAAMEAAEMRRIAGSVASAAFEGMGLDTSRGALDFSDRGLPAASAMRNNPWSRLAAEAGKGRELMFAPSREAARKLSSVAQKLDEVAALLAEGAQSLLGAGDQFTPSWMD